MLQFFADQIDQLDLAIDQLALRDRNFDRFALMLVDNVFELTLHEHARRCEYSNSLWLGTGKCPYDQHIVNAALGPTFDAKIKLAKVTGLLTNETGDSVAVLHQYRNTAHHRGLRHEGILQSLAIFYFRLTCEVIPRFQPDFWSIGTSDQLSHRAAKYLGSPDILNLKECIIAACIRLDEVSQYLGETLVDDLYRDLVRAIDATDHDLNFLVKNAVAEVTRDEVVISAQAHRFSHSNPAKLWAKAHGWNGPHDNAYSNWLSNNYPWLVRNDPIPAWRKRSEQLRSETNLHHALRRYSQFVQQTEKIREQIDDLSLIVDGYIQQQVDEALGK